MNGHKFNFKIWKSCHIYEFHNATLVFYTVIEDGSTKENHFIEIEVNEERIHELTEEEAWNVIAGWEAILAPVGVTPQKRLRNSLYDMYHKKELL
jgi:adenylate cyclase class IV